MWMKIRQSAFAVDHPLQPFRAAGNFLADKAFHRALTVQAAEISEPRFQETRETSVFGAMADESFGMARSDPHEFDATAGRVSSAACRGRMFCRG
ncbi:MAG TPA: hypothetical protein VF583_01125 [Bradyrhizobium sp.]